MAERKILWNIPGRTQREDRSWKVRKNFEIDDLISEPNIVNETAAVRLGHVVRIGEDLAAKRAYLRRPNGRRPVERPKYRWTNGVHKDLKDLCTGDLSDAKTDLGFTALLM